MCDFDGGVVAVPSGALLVSEQRIWKVEHQSVPCFFYLFIYFFNIYCLLLIQLRTIQIHMMSMF